MKKFASYCLIGLSAWVVNTTFAADVTWTGELSGFTPTHAGITEDYCKAHAIDSFQSTSSMIYKKVTGNNGVTSTNLDVSTKKMGAIYLKTGTAMFAGEIDGKAWKEKLHFVATMLQPTGGMEQGVWYTRDCKGFFKTGPSEG